MMAVSQNRKQYKEHLERVAQQQGNYRDFLDKSKSVEERSTALKSSTGLRDPYEVAESVKIIRDRDEDAQIRALALRGISVEIGRSHELIDMTLALLRDDTESVAVRRAALAVLQLSSFITVVFNPKRPEYLAVLRYIVDDEDVELRQEAIEVLAKEKDKDVQGRLIEGLKDPSQALIRPERAIRLLGYDIHTNFYPLLREIIENPPNLMAKREAVRLLAADATSKDLLAKIIKDKVEDPEVRKIGVVALQSLAPAEFEELAKRLVLDDDEDDDLRAISMNALAHFANPESLIQDSEFNRRIIELGQKNISKELKQVVDIYATKWGSQKTSEVLRILDVSLASRFMTSIKNLFRAKPVSRDE
jgi:HEAT repeat protein